MTCDEDPDKGDNSAVEAYIWDNSKIFTTNITITCPVGKILIFVICQTIIFFIALSSEYLVNHLTSTVLLEIA